MIQRRKKLLLVCFLQFLIAGVLTVNDTSAQNDSVDELPPLATARIGDWGDTPKANGIYRLQYSPDGKWLAARDRENVVSIYDTQSDEKVCEVSGHEANWIESIKFSPDSRQFVTAAGLGEHLKVWNTQTGKMLAEIETEARVAWFSNDGKSLRWLGKSHVESTTWAEHGPITERVWRSDK
jgi:WD40 repeat protein